MSEKYIIFGATGSIGSSLAEQLKNSGNDIHLVARNESELAPILEKLGCSHTIADVLEDGFIEKVKSDISEIKGLAYCIGSIDLKPLRMINEQDFQKCMKLNLYSAVEAIKGYQESLKKNKGSIVMFSTVAAQRGFTNHAIIASAKAAVEGLTVSLAAEFMRGIYQSYSQEMEIGNFFNQNRKMKSSWYEGTTGLPPLDYAIKNAVNYGWSHHIERLMILSNIMNLCEIKPTIVYKWFMEMFVDSSDWVMVPNVYGMGLFSDGGIFATKPYICGSAYFMKMMDFKKGDWCNTMDGLYWRFIDRNRKFFLKNPRLSMMVRIFDKMKSDRKKLILAEADKFIKLNTI